MQISRFPNFTHQCSEKNREDRMIICVCTAFMLICKEAPVRGGKLMLNVTFQPERSFK